MLVNIIIYSCYTWILSKADAGQLESEHLLQHQISSTGQCHETRPCGTERRGLWLTAGHRSSRILRLVNHLNLLSISWFMRIFPLGCD